MLLCARCAGRFRLSGRPGPAPAPRRTLARDTSEEVPTSFNADLLDNKTTVKILNEEKDMVFFERFGRYGFKLSTGIFVLGPVLAFPKSVYSWRLDGPAEIGPRSLAALRVIFPRPDIFLLGKGDPGVQVDVHSLTAFFRELGVSWEILPTEEALTTFNFLNSERRQVAGAFLPPSMRDMYKEELQALETAHRSRRFQLDASTGGNYFEGTGAAPSLTGPMEPPPEAPRRRQPEEGDAGVARAAAARAEVEERRRQLEAARKRVDGEGEQGKAK